MLAGTVRMGLDNPRDLPQVRGVAARGCMGLCLQQGIQSVAQDCRRMSAEGTSLSRPSVGAGTVLPTVYVSGQPRPKDKREKLSTMAMGGIIGGGKSPLLLKTVPGTEEPLYKLQLPSQLCRMKLRDTVEISPGSFSS